MTDKELLHFCLSEIEDKLQWGSPLNWGNARFITLSEEILSKTGVTLSVSSLKRLFGKVKYDNTPQYETRNALAMYLGYKSWEEYKEAYTLTSEAIEQPENKQKIFIAVVVCVVLLGVLGLIWIYTSSGQKILLEASNPQGYVPHSVFFKTNKKDDKSVILEYGNKDTLVLNHNSINYLYTHPGIYKAFLREKKKVLSNKLPIHIYSKNWQAYYFFNQKLEHLFLGNLYPHRDSGKLEISPTKLDSFDFQKEQEFWTKYIICKPFNISGDMMIFKGSIKSLPYFWKNHCYSCTITLECENSQISIRFMNPGCERWIKIRVSEKRRDGQYDENLSMFCQNIREETPFSIITKDKEAIVVVHNKEIFRTNYKMELGDLYAISYNFTGVGSVLGTTLSNSSNEVIYDLKDSIQ